MDSILTSSDEELFRHFRQHRDCNALGLLFRRRADELLRLAVFLAPRPTEAEDLVQATFLSAIAHAEQFQGEGRVMSWLCGILTNHARMLRRSERRKQPAPADQVVEDPADAALRGEVRAALRQSIAELPEPYRAVVSLHLENGLDSQEIGVRLQRPAATVRKQMERALDRLRVALPIGLAATFAARLDAQAIADRCAEAARFVDPMTTPTAVAAAATAAHGFRGARALASLAAAATAALVAALAWPVATAPQPSAGIAARSQLVGDFEAPTLVLDAPAGDAAKPAADGRVATAASASLEFAIVDGDGAPLAGVDAIVVADDGRSLPERLTDGRDARAIASAADGVARFSDLAPGIYDLAVPGAPAKKRVRLAGGANATKIALARPQILRGLVVDARGRGVAGAELFASETGMRGDVGHRFAVTGSDGAFVGATHVTSGRIVARHPAHAVGAGVRPQGDRDLLLKLPDSAAPIAVEVVDPRGAPVAGAYVALVPRSQPNQLAPTQHARTDALGLCDFDAPGAMPAAVLASARGVAPAFAEVAPGAGRIRLQLAVPHSLRGRVLTAAGAPLADALVQVTVPDQRTNEPAAPLVARETRTAADGSFLASTLPAGPVCVRVLAGASGGAGLTFVPKVVAAADARVGESAPDCVLTVRELPSLRGRLVAPDGRGLANWNVLATPSLGIAVHRQFRNRSAATDADGWFTIQDLAAHERYELGAAPVALALAGECVPAPVGAATAGEAGLRLVVDPTAHRHELTARALDAAGNVPTGVECELQPLAMPWPSARGLQRDGSVVWRKVPSGDYLLTWIVPGASARAAIVQVRADAERTDLGVVTLAPAVRATVRLQGPAARAGLRVVVRPTPGDKFVAATTDALGVCEFAALPPGAADLLVHGPGLAPIRRAIVLAEAATTIDLPAAPAAIVPISVAFSPAENLFNVQGPLHVQILDADGRVVLEDYPGAARERGLFDCSTGLPAGEYQFIARSLWNAMATTRFAAPATGVAPSVRIQLAR